MFAPDHYGLVVEIKKTKRLSQPNVRQYYHGKTVECEGLELGKLDWAEAVDINK